MKPVCHTGSLGQCTEEHVHKQLEQRLDMSQEQVGEYMHELWDLYCGRLNVSMAEFFVVYDHNTKQLFSAIALFIGTRREEQERYHFDEMYDFIIYTHEEWIAKPDELTCSRLEFEPNQVLFVDDNEQNIGVAKKLGSHTVSCRETEQAMLEIKAALETGQN